MHNKKRTRHTASYLLSHFLNSKESLELAWLTGSLVSILRYIYDVMEMHYTRYGLSICDKSIKQISIYSRVGRATVTRSLALFVKHELICITQKKPRAPTHYGIGKIILTRLTTSLELSTEDETRLTTSLALGSPRAYETPNKAHGEPHVIKACKKDSKKERELSPSLNNFEANEENLWLAKDLKLDLDQELASFKNRHKGKVSQYEFGRWLKNSFEYIVQKSKGKGATEVKSTVQEYAPGHPHYDLMQKLRQGGTNDSPGDNRGRTDS